MSSRMTLLGIIGLLATLGAAQKPASRPSAKPAAPDSEYTLDNGLRVRLVRDDVPGQVAVTLALGGLGRLSEPAGMEGLAWLAENVLEWAQPDDSPEEALVGRWKEERRSSVQGSPEILVFHLLPAPPDLQAAIRIQAMRLFAPVAPSTVELAKKWAVESFGHLVNGRRESTDYFDEVGWSALTQCAFHAKTRIALKDALQPVAADKLAAHIGRMRRPDRAMLTITGDFDEPATRALVAAAFAAPSPPTTRTSGPESRPALVAGASQAHWDVPSHRLYLAWPMPPLGDAAHPALEFAAVVLKQALTDVFPPDQKTVKAPSTAENTGSLFVIGIPLYSAASSDAVLAKVRTLLDAFRSGRTHDAMARAGMGFDVAKEIIRTNSGLPDGFSPLEPEPPNFLRAREEQFRTTAHLRWGQSPAEYSARVERINSDDLKHAMRKHLAPEKATIVTIVGKD